MTQEDKELLLKDLCARLPYEVKFLRESWNYEWDQEMSVIEVLEDIDKDGYVNNTKVYNVEDIKPYLRPMSSMTGEEKEEIAFIRDRDFQSVRKWIHDESIKETGNICPITCGEIDYCNKKHLDYRGLIEKGLALEAPEGMYNIKEK